MKHQQIDIGYLAPLSVLLRRPVVIYWSSHAQRKLAIVALPQYQRMCTALFAFGVHPTVLFFLAFNRDEFLDRLVLLISPGSCLTVEVFHRYNIDVCAGRQPHLTGGMIYQIFLEAGIWSVGVPGWVLIGRDALPF